MTADRTREREWLERIEDRGGWWPAHQFLRDKAAAHSLMQTGLVEIVDPGVPYFAAAWITTAGRALLQETEDEHE